MRFPVTRFAVIVLIAIGLCAIARPTACAAGGPPGADGPWIVVAVSAAPLVAHKQAPADEYFGEQRLSVLGIRSIIVAMNLEGTSPLALPLQLERIDGVRSALAAMLERYPDERWLPGEMLQFAKFLMSKRRPWTDSLAEGYLYYLSARFPSYPDGRTAATLLASYDFMPFDMSEAPMLDPHDRVLDFVFVPIRPRR